MYQRVYLCVYQRVYHAQAPAPAHGRALFPPPFGGAGPRWGKLLLAVLAARPDCQEEALEGDCDAGAESPAPAPPLPAPAPRGTAPSQQPQTLPRPFPLQRLHPGCDFNSCRTNFVPPPPPTPPKMSAPAGRRPHLRYLGPVLFRTLPLRSLSSSKRPPLLPQSPRGGGASRTATSMFSGLSVRWSKPFPSLWRPFVAWALGGSKTIFSNLKGRYLLLSSEREGPVGPGRGHRITSATGRLAAEAPPDPPGSSSPLSSSFGLSGFSSILDPCLPSQTSLQ